MNMLEEAARLMAKSGGHSSGCSQVSEGWDQCDYCEGREMYEDLKRTMDWVGKPDANGDVHCSRLAPERCMWVEGHYGGCATP